MSFVQRGRQILSAIGAVAMATAVVFSGPASPAQAATGPDFGAVIWPGKTEVQPREVFEVWVKVNEHSGGGPVRLAAIFSPEFTWVSILDDTGFRDCSIRFTPAGQLLPGHWVQCDANFAPNTSIKLRVKAPPHVGTYQITALSRSTGTRDANESNDSQSVRIRVN